MKEEAQERTSCNIADAFLHVLFEVAFGGSDGLCPCLLGKFDGHRAAASTQLLQMHAMRFSSVGTSAMSSSVNFASLHQQGTSTMPAAAAAHEFGPPQMGQRWFASASVTGCMRF